MQHAVGVVLAEGAPIIADAAIIAARMIRSSGIAAQLTSMHGRIARGLLAQHGSSVALTRRFLPHAAYLIPNAKPCR